VSTSITQVHPFGGMLREWRDRRRMSQLALALEAEISARHLSFVETGRSAPSRDMVLRLAEHLDVPLRDRNRLLLAAGYAPTYAESSIDAPEMAAVRDAVRRILIGHEPYPAVVVDRVWNLVDTNASAGVLIAGVAPSLLEPPANALRVTLHPAGMAPRIVNLGEWRAHLLGRLRRQVAVSADPELTRLLAELRAYPCDQPEPAVELPGPGDMVVTLRIRHQGRELALLSTIATFGTPLDITVSELSIESFFPADPDTAAVLRG
jgi:transcriptional regulator with XRE-family HTH domain